jgi:hypothetical protein
MPRLDDAPLIANCEDDLVTKEQLALHFGVAPATIDQWRYGRQGKMPQIPYLRLGGTTYFSKVQITWWLNEYQKQRDPYYEERMRRLKEGITVGRPKKRKQQPV